MLQVAASFIRKGKEGIGFGCFAINGLSIAGTVFAREKVSVTGIMILGLPTGIIFGTPAT
jgi:hypothetical protein